MKIMITGGMGFIGSHLCEQLLIEKHDLVVLTKSFLKKYNIANISKKIKIEKIDVTDFKRLGQSIQKNFRIFQITKNHLIMLFSVI